VTFVLDHLMPESLLRFANAIAQTVGCDDEEQPIRCVTMFLCFKIRFEI